MPPCLGSPRLLEYVPSSLHPETDCSPPSSYWFRLMPPTILPRSGPWSPPQMTRDQTVACVTQMLKPNACIPHVSPPSYWPPPPKANSRTWPACSPALAHPTSYQIHPSRTRTPRTDTYCRPTRLGPSPKPMNTRPTFRPRHAGAASCHSTCSARIIKLAMRALE